MATDIIARGMITEYKSGTNIDFKENEDGSVTISASGDVSSEDTVARDTIDNHKLDKNNPHNVTAEQVGLGNVNNTADLDKPISTAVQTALDDKANSKHTHNKSDITDFPNSLPANGGNADTVDGFHVAEYVTTLPEGEYYTEVARINTRGKKIESCDTSNLKVGLADYATNADYAMNSNTVNNHTVDSDVPANAVFTDTTNSDVTASGNPVILDGLQGGVPFSEMIVKGKNLIPSDYMTKSGTYNGVTVTVKNDGRVDLSGTATSEGYILTILVNYPLIGGKKYTFNCNKQYDVNTFNLGLIIRDKNGNWKSGLDSFPKTITADDGDYISSWKLWTYNGVEYSAENIEIQLELGDTATEYEPPITGRELQVNVSGKNLLKYPYNETTKTVNGITFTDNGDGTITANGTATANAAFFLSSKIVYKSGVDYVISGCPNGGDRKFKIKGNSDGVNADDVGYGKTFSFSEDTECSVSILIYKDVTVENLVFRPQLELGSTATPYEPYHGSTTTITPDSNPYVIPNDIRQQDGLNIVSVSEGELSVTGVRKNAAVKKIWDKIGMDLLFDGTVTTGTNCITDNVNGYNFLYFYGNLSSVSGTSGNVTGSLVVPKTARAISAGQSLVVTTGVTYITVNIINIESGVITFTVTPNDSSREIYEFKIYGIK